MYGTGCIPTDTMKAAFVVVTYPALLPYILFVINMLEQVYENTYVRYLTIKSLRWKCSYLCIVLNCRYHQGRFPHQAHHPPLPLDIIITT